MVSSLVASSHAAVSVLVAVEAPRNTRPDGSTELPNRAIESCRPRPARCSRLPHLQTPNAPQSDYDLPCTAPTILPILPWAWPAALLTVPAALLAALLTELAAEPAELLTLVRPSDALDWTLEAASPAFSFAAPAASEVVDALRMPARRTANRDWRTTARDTAKDIVMVRRRGWAMEGGVNARLSLMLAMRGARAFFETWR